MPTALKFSKASPSGSIRAWQEAHNGFSLWISIISLIVTFLGCASVSFVLFLTNRSFSPIVYAEMAVLSLFFGISQGALSSYIPQLFPTVIRATATGFCFNIGRFFTATSVFFVGAMVAFFGGLSNALLTFSVAFLVALAAVYKSKERKI